MLTISKIYLRHPELIIKNNVGMKSLMQQGISEPVFCGYLVYKLKRDSLTSKEEGKDPESIKSNTTPDPGHHMGK